LEIEDADQRRPEDTMICNCECECECECECFKVNFRQWEAHGERFRGL